MSGEIMEPFQYHVYICDQQKPEGVPCCSARGSASVIEALRKQVAAHGLMNEVQITVCGSIGLCERGPNLVVYPEGAWYSGVTPNDVAEIVESHFRCGRPVERLLNRDPAALRGEICANRDKMLAAMRRKDELGAVPDEIMQLARAFQESRAFLTAIELDIFSAVSAAGSTEAVARSVGADPRATEMLMNALTAMGLLQKKDGLFHNSPATARFLTSGSPDNARPALMHSAGLWRRWSTLTDCVRSGAAAAFEEMSKRGDDWTRPFIAAMDRNATERAPHVVQAVGAGPVHRLLDIGGGSGALSIAFARANPELHAEVLDLPTVTPLTDDYIQKAGLADRIQTRVGDLNHDDLGEGYDLILVSAICHMLDPAQNRSLLARCHRALVPGGRLVIQDFLLEADKTAPRAAALFSLNMLVGTEGGASYSVDEYAGSLREAGFLTVQHVRLPGPSGLVIGTH